MKFKISIQWLAMLSILLSFSCKDELEDCYETICTGPNMTNCQEVPRVDSGCFPRDTGTVVAEDQHKKH